MSDDMRFGVLEKGHGANHDGIMADIVRQRKWKVSNRAAPYILCRRICTG
jgi:hypothetical protein